MDVAFPHFFLRLLYRRCVDNILQNLKEACHIGKLAMSLLKQFDLATDQIPKLFYMYHGMMCGLYCEPVQSCVNNLRRGKLSC